MATLITKNSSTAAAVPGSGDLVQGELAVNVTDKKLYTKDAGGNIVKVVGSLGNQEASAVAITGGTISNAALTLNSALTTNGSTGTSGQVLTSQGSGSPAQWTAPATPNGLVLLGTMTTSSGSTSASLTGLGQYESLLLILDNVSLSSSISLKFALSSDNGSTYGVAQQFTGSSSSPTGLAQIFRTRTASVNKPFSTTGAFVLTGSYSLSGIVNAVRVSTESATTFASNFGLIYVYGMG